MNLIDCHSHTKNSPDGSNTVREMCEKAIELGLYAYGISDHCETNCFYEKSYYSIIPNEFDDYDFKSRFESSIAEITSAKEEFDGKLNLLCGIELGQANQDFDAAEKIVSDKRLDYVIGSVHNLTGFADFAFLYYPHENKEHLMEAYYKEMLGISKWGKFDILGHLTYPLRYMEGEQGFKINMSPYEEIIREIFTVLAQNGKGIEINTSGLRQKYGKTFPDLHYLKLFKECGGEIVSLGSDSHCVADLGKGIKDGCLIAKEAGFENLCYFKNRKPVFVKMD